MNRADRRRLQRTVKRSLKPGSLKHPVPESLTLYGGPMDGYVVGPDAPVMQPDWITGLWEAKAAGLYNASLSPTGETFAPPKDATKWADLDEATREPFRQQARAEIPPGRYVPDGPMRAKWVGS